MVTIHESGTALGREAFVASSENVLSYETWMEGAQRTVMVPEGYPISYELDKPVIDPSLMTVGQPYLLMVYGELLFVVKDSDEALDFYGLLRT